MAEITRGNLHSCVEPPWKETPDDITDCGRKPQMVSQAAIVLLEWRFSCPTVVLLFATAYLDLYIKV